MISELGETEITGMAVTASTGQANRHMNYCINSESSRLTEIIKGSNL
jgi:hypothetical protein